MWRMVQAMLCFFFIFAQDLRKNIIQSNLTNATSVIMPSLEQMLLRVIWLHTVERSHTNATSVNICCPMQAHWCIAYENTPWRERLQMLQLWTYICPSSRNHELDIEEKYACYAYIFIFSSLSSLFTLVALKIQPVWKYWHPIKPPMR